MGWLTSRKLIQEVGPWNESLKKDQDGEFFSRVLLKTKQVIMADNTMVYYRLTGPNSISSSKTKESVLSTLQALNMYGNNIKNINNTKLKEALAISYAYFIREYHNTYPTITKEAEKMIMKLGFNIDELDFKGKFGILVKMVGFYNAINLWRGYHKIRIYNR